MTLDTISSATKLIGNKLFHNNIELHCERNLIVENERIRMNEMCEEIYFGDMYDVDSTDEYGPANKK